MAIGIAHPNTQRVGYAPTQPVPYSHALHVGQLGLDCRYCHNTVEESRHSSIPPTQTCMNCHVKIWPTSEKLAPVRDSYETGKSVDWVRVHDLPDFVYFNHSAHVNRGIGCVSCHGRIDKMEVVSQDQPLTMGWCLSCHRAPENHLRPLDKITDMAWEPEEGQLALGKKLLEENHIRNLTDCSTCHR
ncbi:MAG: cytochrome c3 family protein [Candidatus Omnitrophica bacterium]|nr:cytochrome c3 family protein [Candidatus Omnitrophota bacterium]MCA9415637.1 cytochrome c3 family protein [Candidatus Omnitrophota bacterium]MCA9425396.1 cytochrome c3 family protein [Candidatus Omnitrophota bacterium]MCA9431143.1 cytochrome c3 family protein [Candidatus Omnitrophota bacterium]MCA9436620.1 cytochrome c3 family protein [Candidatus Omnitrophota bacterium]